MSTAYAINAPTQAQRGPSAQLVEVHLDREDPVRRALEDQNAIFHLYAACAFAGFNERDADKWVERALVDAKVYMVKERRGDTHWQYRLSFQGDAAWLLFTELGLGKANGREKMYTHNVKRSERFVRSVK